MPDFPGFMLTKDGENLQAKCEGTGATLTFTKVEIGSGELPPGNAPFAATYASATVTVYNQETGVAQDAADNDTGFAISTLTQGAVGVAEISEVICNAASTLAGGEYFKIHTPYLDFHVYYTVDGVGVDPRPAGSIPIVVDVAALDSAIQVAEKTQLAMDHFRVEAREMVRLVTYEMDANISAVSVIGDGTSLLPVQFDNSGLSQGFQWREIGVFADDPDLGEILYSYTNSGSAADPVPASGTPTVAEYLLDIYTKIGTITDVAAVIVFSSTFVSLDQFNTHLNDKAAHGNQCVIVNTNYAANNGEKLLVDTEAGEISVTVPENPAADWWFDFADFAKTFDTNKLVLQQAASGEPIQGLNEDMDVDTKGVSGRLVYTDTPKGWVIA